MRVKVLVTQLYLTLCDPMDCSLPSSLSVKFSRQEPWSGLPFSSPGDRPDPGIEPRSPTLQADSLLRYHITLVRIAIMIKSTNNTCWRGFIEKWILLLCWWECNWCSQKLKIKFYFTCSTLYEHSYILLLSTLFSTVFVGFVFVPVLL